MTESKTTAASKVLATQKSVMSWTLFFTDLFLVCLVLGGGLLWEMAQYTGSWQAVWNTAFTDVYLTVPDGKGFSIVLRLAAEGMAPYERNVTAFFALVTAGSVCFWILQALVRAIADAIWRGKVIRHMNKLTQLAQDARRLAAAEAQRAAVKPRVDDLQDAIDHLSPTRQERLHTGDPDLKGIENAVNDLLDRMQAAYAQQTRFVSDASHELRTPIAVLKGYADLLDRWGKNDPQVRDESIAAIQAEAERMNRLVEQLLFLARGDSGRTQLKPVPLDLADLVKEVWEESRMIDQDHTWLLDAPNPVACEGDRDMLKQALRILADNAAKYTPPGKEISLKAYVDDQNRPCLAVRDQGMGISKEDAAHVFDRFYRSDPARTRQSGGAGLGLSIADWIVTSHGGFLEVYSWENVGTKFTIVLQPTP